MIFLGFDTSNYTTSVAAYGEQCAQNCSRLLPVREGELGLRQSDALFCHVRALPEQMAQLRETIAGHKIAAIGVSTRPRAVEGSYMPCFLAGESTARVLAQALDVPLHTFSHQQGHIAASLWSAGRMDLMDEPHLAWHLSGGTTELLLVEPERRCVRAKRIGGTEDISAGQLIDRTGKLLGLPFPAGKALDALSGECTEAEFFRVKLRGLGFSFSGLENKVQAFQAVHNAPETAAYAIRSVVEAVLAVTRVAQEAYPGLAVVFSGGVASNAMLRRAAQGQNFVFAAPEYSTDNALGIAVLTAREEA